MSIANLDTSSMEDAVAAGGPVGGGPARGKEALAYARGIASVLAEHRDEAEEGYRLTPASLEALGGGSLFSFLAPVEVGGYECSLPEIVDLMEELGHADPTAAWHVGNSGISGLAAGSLDPDSRSKLWARRDLPLGFSNAPSGKAKVVDGGYLLSGRWPFVTGAKDAAWVALGSVIMDGDEPRRSPSGSPASRLLFVPAAEVTVHDTWQGVSAMRGSGSHSVSVTEAFVPEGLSFAMFSPAIQLDRPLYRLPVFLSFATIASSVGLGVWRAAVEAAADAIGAKVSSIDGGAQAKLATVQETLAAAESERRAWLAGCRQELRLVWEAAEAGPTTPAQRAPAWAVVVHAVDRARRSISDLYAASSTTVWAYGHPLERALRDIHSISVSFERLKRMELDFGALLAGLEPGGGL